MTDFVAPDLLRAEFSRRLSALYAKEVPAFASLVDLIESANRDVWETRGDPRAGDAAALAAISEQRHGAIRVGSGAELQLLRRLFALFGMQPVDFYDLVPAGLPVFSTAFRPISAQSIDVAPFRVFCSLLRTELIEDAAVRALAEKTLHERQIFSDELLDLLATLEQAGGVTPAQAEALITESMRVFQWTGKAQVSTAAYRQLLESHRLIADVVAFPGPHINHLTPSALDIDAAQARMKKSGFENKAVIEGPPPRQCPILLRQTAFNAVSEPVRFADGAVGEHTARFGEVEQRGVALTPKGRQLYDACLQSARRQTDLQYAAGLTAAFSDFPDDWQTLLEEDLVYGRFTLAAGADLESLGEMDLSRPIDRARAVAKGVLQMEPIRYEDFLPVSAAGIFRSNLRDDQGDEWSGASSQAEFEAALGCPVLDSQAIYSDEQKTTLANLAASV